MITHIVAFSAKDKNDIPKIRDGLMMLAAIPHAKHLSVHDNLKFDQWSDEMDVVLHAEFDSAQALEQFKQHDIYQRCIEVVKPIRDKRIVLDYRK